MRTCVGCRSRAAKSDLLRVVGQAAGPTVRVVPDPQGCMSGRGAHLHPDPECLALAERRKAFGRALRVAGRLDATPVREWVETEASPADPGPGRQSPERADTAMSAR